MDLRQLEIIRAIANSGSFTAAGETLHVSQSAISRQILLLEEELGEAVFYRIGRRIRITPAGESLLQLSHRVFKDVQDTVTAISDKQESLKGTISAVKNNKIPDNLELPRDPAPPEHIKEFRTGRVTAGLFTDSNSSDSDSKYSPNPLGTPDLIWESVLTMPGACPSAAKTGAHGASPTSTATMIFFISISPWR